MKHLNSRFPIAIFLILIIALVAGCNSWEKQTFQLLSGAQSLIVEASTKYNAGEIEQSTQNYNLLIKAQQTKDLAVIAFDDYTKLKLKLAGDVKSGAISKQDAAAQLELAIGVVNEAAKDIPGLVAQIQAVMQKPKPVSTSGLARDIPILRT